MRRVCSSVVVILMTANTSIRSIIVITVMTISAICNARVSSDQLIKLIMNRECCWLPIRICGMTLYTICWKRERCMTWIWWSIVIILMTSNAFSRSPLVTGFVTIEAIHTNMCTGQREVSCIMIECDLVPGDRIMTHLAIRRITLGNMIRRNIIIIQMTWNTVWI